MIKDLFHKNRPTYSLEVFPPKKDADVSVIYDALDEFKALHPSFISVTYGAGGNTAENTFAIASYIQNQCGIEALTHLTCAAIPDELFFKKLPHKHLPQWVTYFNGKNGRPTCRERGNTKV